ncbi:hypothetical protein SEA_LUNA18_23 [Microbacterium phage Luna18]|nr:hypothetical protein SEA_CHEPLI_23 [Microbacterium phage Chepli]QZE10311.1 hypothetical protein SEA_KATCHAN_23 [Microbacterium phage KatChan]URQ04874.1 hypothetical protein SEA_LUNA18_23 [Microbacterium phage Luna18]
MAPQEVPDHDGLREILSAEGAPPCIVLDIGGSADLDGDGLVSVALDENGDLEFKDV